MTHSFWELVYNALPQLHASSRLHASSCLLPQAPLRSNSKFPLSLAKHLGIILDSIPSLARPHPVLQQVLWCHFKDPKSCHHLHHPGPSPTSHLDYCHGLLTGFPIPPGLASSCGQRGPHTSCLSALLSRAGILALCVGTSCPDPSLPTCSYTPFGLCSKATSPDTFCPPLQSQPTFDVHI